MTIVRVIPCLDVAAGRVVKGVNFENLRDAGDPVELAERYCTAGADELAFLDVTASATGKETLYDVVARTAAAVTVPFTVGGGVRTVTDVARLLEAGADRVSVNTAALEQPQLINDIADRFGAQVLVLSVDARASQQTSSGYEVTTHGGKHSAGKDALEWAVEGENRGVGEILLNSMDADGTTGGFDLEMLAAFRAAVNLPLIASGGAGKVEDFVAAAKAGANAVLAASVFHFGVVSIGAVKEALSGAGIRVR